AAFCEILDIMTHPFYPNPEEYHLLLMTLDQMEKAVDPLPVRLRSTLVLLKILGYGLRHHSAWRSFSAEQRSLLTRLAKWDGQNEFSTGETDDLERMTQSYLSLFLPHPLKTDIFQHNL